MFTLKVRNKTSKKGLLLIVEFKKVFLKELLMGCLGKNFMAMPAISSTARARASRHTLLNPRQLAADLLVSLNIQTTLLGTTLKQIQLAFVIII